MTNKLIAMTCARGARRNNKQTRILINTSKNNALELIIFLNGTVNIQEGSYKTIKCNPPRSENERETSCISINNDNKWHDNQIPQKGHEHSEIDLMTDPRLKNRYRLT